MELENLFIGVKDWNREVWIGAFYPIELPEEWRLDFYVNHFRTALVPESVWLAWRDDDVDEILEVLEGDHFYLTFEWQAQSDVSTAHSEANKKAQLSKIKSKLVNIAAGVVVFEQDSIAYETMLCDMPVTLISSETTLKKATWVWQNQGLYYSGEPCAVLACLPEDTKQQVSLIQSFMQSLPEDKLGAPFIITDEVRFSQLNDLQVLSEMLGY